MVNSGTLPYREVKDRNGRIYRIGEDPRQLMGYGRTIMIILPWIGMMLASALEYGWGAASATVAQEYHWNLTTAFWNYSVYVLFEAGVSYFNGYLRERGKLTPKYAIMIGGILVAAAYFFLAHSVQPWISYAGYAALGGLGSGLVYSTCVAMVSKWYPDKKGWRTGFVDGGWAYGAVPFIILYATHFNTHDFISILYLTGVTLGGGLFIISFWFRDPPKNWWPEQVDPLKWSEDKSIRALRHNPPAINHLNTRQMWRTGKPFWMLIEFMLIAGTSLFGVGFYFPFATAEHLGTVAIIAGATGFAFTDGIGRPIVAFFSDYVGRHRAMVIVYAILGISSILVLYAGLLHSAGLFVIFALLAGGTSGSLFVLNPLMTSDYFGENHLTQNYGTIYAGKVVGGFYGGVVSAVIVSAGAAGYTWAFWVAGVMALVASLIALAFLKRPTKAQIDRVLKSEGVPANELSTTPTV